MTSARQRAVLELSAKFDDERRARELELLRRDNALKAAEMRTQTLRQQFILAGGLFVTCICAALGWAFARVRRANDRLRFNSERDALTGLRNRRYFNEHVLSVEGTRPDRRLRAARGPRSFQAHQRHPGAPCGRCRARDGQPSPVGRPAGERQARALGRRGVSRRARPDHPGAGGSNRGTTAACGPARPGALERASHQVHDLHRLCMLSDAGLGNGDLARKRDRPHRQGALRGQATRTQSSLLDPGGQSRTNKQELTIICDEFESAAADQRIQLVDMGSAA